MTTVALAEPVLEPMTALLRRETRAEHAEAERWVPLLGPGVTLVAYRAYLEAMLAYCGPLEIALASVPGLDDALPDWRFRRKLPFLARDLNQLAAMGCRREALVDSSFLVPRNVAQAFGCLYVVEGATLGGQVIARHLRASLGIDRSRAGAFLHCYGDEVGAMWKAFGRALDAFAPTWAHRGEMLVSARSAFENVTTMLSSGPRSRSLLAGTVVA